ncbi:MULTISPECIES: FAD-dependent monooxygenase [unclassified Rhizobacter]|uniref:FAD-dependent monooxygenase n=1 Tax=unclassified Rhizobacter TaxID=2640088 RepID=UPI0006FACF57|nr:MULTISPECIES: FAD-dependent monooxygenase [unclassified Rhizobacter]KQU78465.1 2-octaprenyl-6-methoxyphenyl hydroxylase [Rhizobacter sp. Root29]KQW10985.1 2-octaprenyl-6-methoxyphenyl hydroxylase [Rhizobacter sp. Root1238]KRB25331.1 2-octaprenyl-6-methoxyphenyl hydroxylase [Rhizobacter sp. Root16D2]
MNAPRPTSSPAGKPLTLAVVGAGPVGLALALLAAQSLPQAQVSVFDARPLDKDVSGDPRTLALSLGSVQLLQRLEAWQADAAQPIVEVHVSQQPPSLGAALAAWVGEPTVRISALEEAVPMLGAVLSYGGIVAPLQRAWLAACEREPQRLLSRFGQPVQGLKPMADGVEVDAGIAERFDLAVVAEGGVFSQLPRERLGSVREPLHRDYRQTAWVGTVTLANARPGVAYERFTRHGPAALLPLKNGQASLVWCVPGHDDPVEPLNDAQRLAVLNTMFDAEVGAITAVSPLKRFALGLSAERTLTDGRTVRIGNAAQTLHPVAGQGLNLGLRDAFELVQALSRNADVAQVLRRLEWQRGPDRWAMIAATDFLARSFTWKLPGAGAARGLGMVALQALKPVKSALARQMMFGSR